MAGFIAITTEEWIEFLKGNNNSSAVFWCKKKSFKALKKGEEFFFLRRSIFKTNADRFIVSKGKFVEFQHITSSEIWNRYGDSVGFKSQDTFNEKIKQLYQKDTLELGCIILEKLEFFDTSKSLPECDIDFSPYIVSGKTISDDECRKINENKETQRYE